MPRKEQTSSLGELELVVMLAVMRTDEAYSRTIRDAIRTRTGRNVARGALYVTLNRLTEKGLLRSWKGEPRSERGGKARRYYEVTAGGLEAVRSSQAMLQKMWEGLEEALSQA